MKLFTSQKTDFSKNRKLPFEKIVAQILNFPKRSLSIELGEFFNFIEEPEICCNKVAFSLQRVKLRPDFFQVWNCWWNYFICTPEIAKDKESPKKLLGKYKSETN